MKTRIARAGLRPTLVLGPTLGRTGTGRSWVDCGDRESWYSVDHCTRGRMRDGELAIQPDVTCVALARGQRWFARAHFKLDRETAGRRFSDDFGWDFPGAD